MGLINNNWCERPWLEDAWCGPVGTEMTHVEVQVVVPGSTAMHVQVEINAYNITLLRVLWEIKSDGTTALNYTASSEASADKGVVNLKSDILEKYWQTTGCAAEWFQFDAGSGKVISMDTLALIAHNLTNSAVVTVKGYGTSIDAAPANHAAWASVPVYATLTMPDDPDETNLIYIAPVLPTDSFRHWLIDIEDSTNTAGVIRIGRVVGGSSLIFNGENCLDTVGLTDQNYKDEMKLNGFSGIANNRALKRAMKLTFRDLDSKQQSNYKRLKRYTRYCRDTLKALVILDPKAETTKYQFTVFAKLKSMPSESHVYVDDLTNYTSFELEYDEAK